MSRARSAGSWTTSSISRSGPAGTPAAARPCEPIARASAREPLGECLDDLGAAQHAIRIARPLLVLGPLGPVERLRTAVRHCASFPIASTIAPSRASNVWYGTIVRMRVAVTAGGLAGHEGPLATVDERRDADLEQRHVEMAAAAAAQPPDQRREHRRRGVDAGEHVDDGDARP